MIKGMQEFCSPVHLTAQHDLEDFQSGEESLDSWLRGRAMDNMEMGASRTYVICPFVHAISPEAEAFYVHHGFSRLPTETPTYALDLVRFSNPSA